MPRDEDSGYEVLLGNRQLLSIFFIVVILLAVFFTMGFVLGRNSASGGAPATASSGAAIAPRTQSPSPSPAGPPSVAPSDTAPATAEAKPAPPAQAAVPVLPTEPPAGQTFLQAIAAKRPEAELIAEVLKKQGFSVVLAPSPDGSTVRVLVGPLTNATAVADTRKGLEKAGFDKAFVRKY